MAKKTSKNKEFFVNPLKNQTHGWRTGKNVTAGKIISVNKHGFENFEDYFSESDADVTREVTMPVKGACDKQIPNNVKENIFQKNVSNTLSNTSAPMNASQKASLWNPNIGRRTGKNVLKGKVITKNQAGFDNFEDYWSESDGDSLMMSKSRISFNKSHNKSRQETISEEKAVSTDDETQPEEQDDDETQPEEQEDDETQPEEQEDDETQPEEQEDDETQPEQQEEDETQPEQQEEDETQPEQQEEDETQPEQQDDDEKQPEQQDDDEKQPEQQVEEDNSLSSSVVPYDIASSSISGDDDGAEKEETNNCTENVSQSTTKTSECVTKKNSQSAAAVRNISDRMSFRTVKMKSFSESKSTLCIGGNTTGSLTKADDLGKNDVIPSFGTRKRLSYSVADSDQSSSEGISNLKSMKKKRGKSLTATMSNLSTSRTPEPKGTFLSLLRTVTKETNENFGDDSDIVIVNKDKVVAGVPIDKTHNKGQKSTLDNKRKSIKRKSEVDKLKSFNLSESSVDEDVDIVVKKKGRQSVNSKITDKGKILNSGNSAATNDGRKKNVEGITAESKTRKSKILTQQEENVDSSERIVEKSEHKPKRGRKSLKNINKDNEMTEDGSTNLNKSENLKPTDKSLVSCISDNEEKTNKSEKCSITQRNVRLSLQLRSQNSLQVNETRSKNDDTSSEVILEKSHRKRCKSLPDKVPQTLGTTVDNQEEESYTKKVDTKKKSSSKKRSKLKQPPSKLKLKKTDRTKTRQRASKREASSRKGKVKPDKVGKKARLSSGNISLHMASPIGSSTRLSNVLETVATPPTDCTLSQSVIAEVFQSGVSYREKRSIHEHNTESTRSIQEDVCFSPAVTIPAASPDLTPCIVKPGGQKKAKGRRVTISKLVEEKSYVPSNSADSSSLQALSISSDLVHICETTTSASPKIFSRPERCPIIFPEKSENGLRRSQRTRVLPVEWYKGERVRYKPRKSGGYVVSGIIPSQEAKILAMEEKRRQNRKAANKRRKNKNGTRQGSPPRNLSMHEKIPSDFELSIDPTIPVVNPGSEEEVNVECFAPKNTHAFVGPSREEPRVSDPFLMSRSFDQKLFGTGILLLRPLQEKSLQLVHKGSLILVLDRGLVCVTIHRTSLLMEAGDSCFVPDGNTYSLRNMRSEEAKFHYTIIKHDHFPLCNQDKDQ